MLKTIERLYLLFAMVVFSTTATGKLLSNFADARLKSYDSFISILTAGQLLVVVAIVEILVVILLMRAFIRDSSEGVPIVIWLCSLFGIYRLGFQFAPNRAGRCKCFGVGSILGKMEPMSDVLGMILLLTMFLIGAGIVLLKRRKPDVVCVNQRIIISVGFATLAFSASSVDAQDLFAPLYNVEGVVTEFSKNPAGKIVNSREYPFQLAVDSAGRWQISWQTYYQQWSLNSTQYLSYNGVDIFSVQYSDKRLDRNLKPIVGNDEYPAVVSRGPFPADFGSGIGLVWIAFLGGEYVAEHGASELPCLLVSNPRADPIAWSTDFQHKIQAESPNPLIASGKFYLNRKKVHDDLLGYPELNEPSDSAKMEKLLLALKHYKLTKDDELLRSTYTLDESKSIGRFFVPVRFSATLYSPPDSIAGHVPMIEWIGAVTNIITNMVTKTMLPPIKGRVYVQDRRFKQRTSKQYFDDIWYPLDASGWVLSTNNSKFSGTNSIHLRLRESMRLEKTAHQISLIVFGVLALAPIFFVVRNLYRKRHSAS